MKKAAHFSLLKDVYWRVIHTANALSIHASYSQRHEAEGHQAQRYLMQHNRNLHEIHVLSGPQSRRPQSPRLRSRRSRSRHSTSSQHNRKVAWMITMCLSVMSLAIALDRTAIAQNAPTARPTAFNIVGTKGTTEQRTLVLRLPQASSTPINIYTFDLYNADSTIVFPSSAIKIPEMERATQTNEFVSIPITFDLTQLDLPSGEFTGELLLIYDDGELPIPVLVRVKDNWPLPLVLLVLGVVLGMAVSSYSSGGRLSDEVTVKLDQLQAQIRQYRDIARPFADRAEMFIVDARNANDAKQLEAAQQAASRARLIWSKWYRQKTEWHSHLIYYNTLIKQIDKELAQSSTRYIQTIKYELDDLIRTAPDFPDPASFQRRLRAIAKQLRDYGQMRDQFAQLKEAVAKRYQRLSKDEQKEFDENMVGLEKDIRTITPDEEGGINTVTTNIQKVLRRLNTLISTTYIPVTKGISDTTSEAEQPQTTVRSGLTFIPEPTTVPDPSHHHRSNLPSWFLILMKQFWPDADGRLRGFYFLSYFISVVVLASGGFHELYIAKNTFGSNFWGDYFALLAWGFGAEATRNTVTQVVRKTNESNNTGGGRSAETIPTHVISQDSNVLPKADGESDRIQSTTNKDSPSSPRPHSENDSNNS